MAKKKTDSKRVLLAVIIILAIVSILVSSYLVENHLNPPKEGSFCDLGETVSCSVVNTSVYAKLFHVPVAIYGLLWALVLGLFAWASMKKDGANITFLFGWTVIGFLFVIYLIAAEFILKAICPMCTVVHVISLVVLILATILYSKEKKKPKMDVLVKKAVPWAIGVLILYAIPTIFFNVGGENLDYSAFTQCLDDNGVVMYGSFRCGVCARTRAFYGEAFENINEIECHPQGENPQTELCQEKQIEITPTWIREVDGEELGRLDGFQKPESLAELSGCSVELIQEEV